MASKQSLSRLWQQAKTVNQLFLQRIKVVIIAGIRSRDQGGAVISISDILTEL